MRLGILLSPGIHAAELSMLAEQNGFESAWYVDSPAVFGDVYVSMAAAAAGTSTLTLGTGVTNPVTRRPLITAATMASLNALAPGRVVLGIGVGHSGTAALGLPRARLKQLETYVGQFRTLLGKGEIEESPGVYQALLNHGEPWVNLQDYIPVVVGAAGPRSINLAGRIADGVILGGVTDLGIIGACHDRLSAARRSVHRALDSFDVCVSPSVHISDTPVPLDELRELIGPKSLGPARNFLPLAREVYGEDAALPKSLEKTLSAFQEPRESDSRPADPRSHLRVYAGYMTRLTEWQLPLITQETLDMTSITGTPDEWIQKIAILEAAGVTRVILSPLPHLARETIEKVGKWVLPQL